MFRFETEPTRQEQEREYSRKIAMFKEARKEEIKKYGRASVVNQKYRFSRLQNSPWQATWEDFNSWKESWLWF